MITIFLVSATSGDYERSTWNVRAFDNGIAAADLAKTLNDYRSAEEIVYREAITAYYADENATGQSPQFRPHAEDPRMDDDASYSVEMIQFDNGSRDPFQLVSNVSGNSNKEVFDKLLTLVTSACESKQNNGQWPISISVSNCGSLKVVKS